MIKKAFVTVVCCSLLLCGCWNSIELNEVIMVMGAGFDKTEQGFELSVEVLKSSGGSTAGESQNEGMVLSIEGQTFFECVRNLIRKSKRRLYFTHTNIWVVSERLARDNFTDVLDTLRRDQMPRLNSLLLITSESPKDILATSTVTEDLTSVEMAESMEATGFTSQFQPMEIKRVFEMLSGPVPTTYIPIIRTNQSDEEVITEVNGVALIKNNRMVGRLNVSETKGLLYLRGEGGVGAITTELKQGQKVSIEGRGEKVKIVPTLQGKQLTVNINIDVQGELSEVPNDISVNDNQIREMEQVLMENGKEKMEKSIKKLQELKVDVLDFGNHVHRKYPKQWHVIKDEWDDIFANALVKLDVNCSINHRGLINNTEGGIYDKPQFLPFFFSGD